MSRLNQILAVEKGIKSRVTSEVTELHKLSQKAGAFEGQQRHYEPIDVEGEQLPPERKQVQFIASELLTQAEKLWAELMSIEARKEWTNATAVADLVVNGLTLVAGVPVTYLLFLEKQLTDLVTFCEKLPVLDPGEDWKENSSTGLRVTEPVRSHRTKKTQRPIVLYQATPEHPAQTQMITEDVLAGHWVTVKQSGAMPLPERKKLVARAQELLRAVKQAREGANMVEEVRVPDVGAAIFTYLHD